MRRILPSYLHLKTEGPFASKKNRNIFFMSNVANHHISTKCIKIAINGFKFAISRKHVPKNLPSIGSSLILMSPSRKSGLRSFLSRSRSRSLSRLSRFLSERSRSRDRDRFRFFSFSRLLRSRSLLSSSSVSRSRERRFLRSRDLLR